eukprot:GHVN01049732.1.p1 GENE.GHVN01049732.1~~GHVN01049732.1.p1  ORF type:complete len:252 (+),score=55.03 GHVN01049732.1:109-864(+)
MMIRNGEQSRRWEMAYVRTHNRHLLMDRSWCAADMQEFQLPEIPETPFTTLKSIGDEAAALREWLSNAEALVNGEKEKVSKAREGIRMKCEDEFSKATEEYDKKTREMQQQLEQRCEKAERTRDRKLQQCKLNNLSEIEEQMSNIQHRAEELERLRDVVESERQDHPTPSSSSARALKRPHEHLCPITTEVMADPVILFTCGDTFERIAIEKWFTKNETCPLCRKASDKKVMANKVVKRMIEDWEIPRQGG